jgi:hypothetical protein
MNLTEEGRSLIRRILFILAITLSLSSCYWNAGRIKGLAENRLNEAGFRIVLTEGTQMSPTGGIVWYLVKRSDSSGYYEVALQYMLSGDLGLYNLVSVDQTRAKLEE